MTGSAPELQRVMMGLHEALDARFFAHQRALLDRDFARAASLLDEYRSRLLQHIADEEEAVLPRYVAAGGDATDAPSRLFRGEHDKLRGFVAEFVRRIAALRERPEDRGLLELFDRQATFKNLMLHHDLREKAGLYPLVAARLPAVEQRAIVQGLRWAGG